MKPHPMIRAASRRAAFRPREHDHADCRAAAIHSAERLCARRGARLTEIRRRVLELVWRSHQPVGAYSILERLGRERGRVAPPTVYRALDFLIVHGLVHRIASLNAFIGCAHPGRDHIGQFLVCSGCGSAAELDDRRIDQAIRTGAEAAGFSVERPVIELAGRCPNCREETRDAAR
jgi:Fur family transcriptional regulator, zinc uptake regulator